MSGRLVILSGPSGVGKDTVIDAWRARNPRVQRVVAATTRAPRPHEIPGVDYHFKSRREFDEMVAQEQLLEHKLVFGNFYGTPLAEMESLLADDKIAVLKIDVQGGIEVMSKRPDALSVFLMAPDNAALEERLRGRGTDAEDVIERRLQTAREEIAAGLTHYQLEIVNDRVERVVDQLEALVFG